MQIRQMQYTFKSVISYDEGETLHDVTVGYDYTPAERNYPHEPDYAEEFEVFVFDGKGEDITSDVLQDDYKTLEDEAKDHFKQVLQDANEY